MGTQKRPRRHGAPSRAPRDAQASRIGGENAPRFPHPPAHPPHFCAISLFHNPCSLTSPGAGQSLPCPPRRHKPSWPRSRLGLPQRAAYSECPRPLPPCPPPTTSLGSPLPDFRVLRGLKQGKQLIKTMFHHIFAFEYLLWTKARKNAMREENLC